MIQNKKVKLGAGIILYNEDNEIMLQLRENIPEIRFPNCWVLFGGGIEANEFPKDAITREIFEETSMILTNPEFIRTYYYEDDKEVHHQYIFKYKIDKGLRTLNITEGAGYKLYKKEDIDKIEFGFNIKQIVVDFYRGLENE